MKLIFSFPKALVAAAITISLSGCSNAPTIRDSRVATGNLRKAENIHFIYRHIDMQIKSSYGRGSLTSGDTGYFEFGQIMVDRAPQAFAKYGVTVLESRKLKGNEPITVHFSADEISSGRKPVLLVYPVSGRASTSGHVTTVAYTFQAELIETATKRITWKAVIDTSTWSGQDFLLRHATKTLYDDAYADQLFTVIADRMKGDGVI